MLPTCVSAKTAAFASLRKVLAMYQFRIDEDQPGAGEVIEVDFETMMEAEDGFLALEDGRTARRINRPSTRKVVAAEKGASPKIVSSAMGFSDFQLAEMEQDRKANGFTGVEFHPDPHEPRHYQVHCSSERVKSEYMKHRGFIDRNSRNGSAAMISEEQLERAKDFVVRSRGKA